MILFCFTSSYLCNSLRIRCQLITSFKTQQQKSNDITLDQTILPKIYERLESIGLMKSNFIIGDWVKHLALNESVIEFREVSSFEFSNT